MDLGVHTVQKGFTVPAFSSRTGLKTALNVVRSSLCLLERWSCSMDSNVEFFVGEVS